MPVIGADLPNVTNTFVQGHAYDKVISKTASRCFFLSIYLTVPLDIHICNKIKILSVKLYLKWLVLCGKTCWSLQWQRIMGNAFLSWKLVEDFVISPTRPQTFDSSTVKGHNNIPYPPSHPQSPPSGFWSNFCTWSAFCYIKYISWIPEDSNNKLLEFSYNIIISLIDGRGSYNWRILK